MTAERTKQCEPGDVVAGYRLEEEIGHGAMARVYLATQLNLERRVAVKILDPELALDPAVVARFTREARLAAAVAHPHVVQIYTAGTAAAHVHYLAMEFVQGETLLDCIRREGPLALPEALRMAAELATALEHGYRCWDLTHGDIKPGNIMLDASRQVKLADFGLARVGQRGATDTEILLTPLYAAPELIRAGAAGAGCRADIYAFGATLYHMLAGQPPFPNTDPEEVLQRHVTEVPAALRERNPAVPEPVSALVAGMLKKAPAERPENWRAILRELEELRRLCGGAPAAAGRVPAVARQRLAGKIVPPRWRREWGAAAVAGAICLAGAAGIWYGITGSRAAAPASRERTRVQRRQREAAAAWADLAVRLEDVPDPLIALQFLQHFEDRYGLYAPAVFAEKRQTLHAFVDTNRTDGLQRRVLARPPTKAAPAAEAADAIPATGTLAARVAQARSAQNDAPAPGQTAADAGPDPQASAADEFTEYLTALSGLGYDASGVRDKLMGAGRAWLQRHPRDSRDRDRARFVVDVFLPALDEFLPGLVTRQAQLAGRTLSDPDYGGITVAELTLTGFRAFAETAHGRIGLHFSWDEDGRPYLIQLGWLLLSAGDPAPSDLRSYLALLLVTREFGRWNDVIARIPNIGERQLWTSLRQDFAGAEGEGLALERWQRAVALFAAGARVQPYRLLRQLATGGTAVAERHRREIDVLLAQAALAVPEIVAGRLLHTAQTLVSTAPESSLALMGLALTRYGRVSVPEWDALPELRRQALARVQRPPGWKAARRPPPLPWFRPFLTADRTRSGAWALLVCHELGRRRQQLPRAAELLPALRAAALIALADWRQSRPLLASGSEALTSLPVSARAAVLFAKVLAAQRYGYRDAGSAATTTLGALFDGLGSGHALTAPIGALVYEALLLGEPGAQGPDPVRCWDRIKAGPRATGESRRFFLAALAWCLDSGRKDTALRLLADTQAGAGAAAEAMFSTAELDALQRFRKAIRTGVPLAESAWPGGTRELEYWVLLAVTAGDLLPLPAAGRGELPIPAQTRSAGHMTGPALWRWALCCVGMALTRDDLDAALRVTAALLAREDPALSAWYPRVCFLQAGLQYLAGLAHKARETLELVPGAGVSNVQEISLAQRMLASAENGEIGTMLPTSQQARFWTIWLGLAQGLARERNRIGAREMDGWLRCAGRICEKRLINGFRDYAEAPAAATRRDP